MIVSLSHVVPVQVLVDLETGKVTRVVIIDESIAPSDDYNVDYATDRPLPVAFVEHARVVAANAEWPGWDRGW